MRPQGKREDRPTKSPEDYYECSLDRKRSSAQFSGGGGFFTDVARVCGSRQGQRLIGLGPLLKIELNTFSRHLQAADLYGPTGFIYFICTSGPDLFRLGGVEAPLAAIPLGV
jgi:hypothetical protein